jgi:hypothetical protein
MADPRLDLAKSTRKARRDGDEAADVVAGRISLAEYLGLDVEARRELLERACARVESGHFASAREILELLDAVGEAHPSLPFLLSRCLHAEGALPAAQQAAVRAVDRAQENGLAELAELALRWLTQITPADR